MQTLATLPMAGDIMRKYIAPWLGTCRFQGEMSVFTMWMQEMHWVVTYCLGGVEGTFVRKTDVHKSANARLNVVMYYWCTGRNMAAEARQLTDDVSRLVAGKNCVGRCSSHHRHEIDRMQATCAALEDHVVSQKIVTAVQSPEWNGHRRRILAKRARGGW
jgi:hypothetical protein